MNTNRSLVLAALTAAITLGGCATSAGSGGSALPAVAPPNQTLSTQSVAPATLTVTASVPPIHLSGGGSQFVPCAVRVTSGDNNGAYMVIAMFAPGSPGTSTFLTKPGVLMMATPDLGTPAASLTTAFPGTTLWRGARGQTQSHCIDMTISVPIGQPGGTYSETLRYVMLEQVRGSLYATRALGTAAITTTVAARGTR